MEYIEKYILGFPENFKYEQVITGIEHHPREVKKIFEVPEYIKRYSEIDYFFEVMHVVKGKAVIVLNKRSFVLKEGDIAVIKDGMKHHESYYTKDTPYELAWFIYDNTRKFGIANTRYDPQKGFSIISCLTFKMEPENYFLLDGICGVEQPEKNMGRVNDLFRDWISAIKKEIIEGRYEKAVFTEEFIKTFTVDSRRIQKAVDYIKKNYKRSLTLKDISSQVSLSPAYFCVLFKKIFNNTPFELITDLRLREAYELLKKSALNVNQIAFKVGYSDATLFRHIFKKYTGISAKEYRERNLSFDKIYNPDDGLYNNKLKT